jgi:hypothetical protein
MQVDLSEAQTDLLLRSLDTLIQMARRAKWPLSQVQPLINLMHAIDTQTLYRHASGPK